MQEQIQSWRDWLADHMGVDEAHKESLYLEVSQGATLLRVNYWLELVFAAGIATLGLALNSPAVIIGAMLISPLMSPILSMGLSLASGDFILAIRSITNLVLSSLFAILLATTLVYLLPFKEITNEIAGRTNPNLLDLVVALFSGAIGSISTCKPMKGIVNSIPGVAIAVALMPPLCVVGHGIGIGISHNFTDGMRVATGGGLLFITNIVAITFTAMLVFLSLHIDTNKVKEKAREWNRTDRESQIIQKFLSNNKLLQHLRPIGSLQGRLMMIMGIVLLLMIPLTKSIDRLTREISGRNEENRIRRVVRDVWYRQIAQDQEGETRSFLNQLSIQRREQELVLNMTTFTSLPLTPEERTNYIKEVARDLGREPGKIFLNLVEVPTSQFQSQPPVALPTELTLQELHTSFFRVIDSSITGLEFPGDQELVGYKIISNNELDLTIQIAYLAENRMSMDAETLLARTYVQSIPMPKVSARLDFIDGSFKAFPMESSSTNWTELDRLAESLSAYPKLLIEIYLPESSREKVKEITNYLAEKHLISTDRVIFQNGKTTGAKLKLSR